jgi:hypothetical protein
MVERKLVLDFVVFSPLVLDAATLQHLVERDGPTLPDFIFGESPGLGSAGELDQALEPFFDRESGISQRIFSEELPLQSIE